MGWQESRCRPASGIVQSVCQACRLLITTTNSSGQLISKLAYNSEQVADAATRSVIAAFRDIMLVIMLLAVMLTANLMLLTLVMLLLVPMIGLLVTAISHRFRKDQPPDPGFHGGCFARDGGSGSRPTAWSRVFQGQSAERQTFWHSPMKKHVVCICAWWLTRLTSSSMVQLAAGSCVGVC